MKFYSFSCFLFLSLTFSLLFSYLAILTLSLSSFFCLFVYLFSFYLSLSLTNFFSPPFFVLPPFFLYIFSIYSYFFFVHSFCFLCSYFCLSSVFHLFFLSFVTVRSVLVRYFFLFYFYSGTKILLSLSVQYFFLPFRLVSFSNLISSS